MPIIIEEPTPGILEITVDRPTLRLRLLSLGAAIRSVEVPDSSGALGHVHLSLPTVADYADVPRNPHLGATIGRYANRIANARFTLDGTEYLLDANRPPHTLHGGERGFDRLVWSLTEATSTPEVDRVVFGLHSPDGDMGFPGNLTAESVYEITNDTLTFHYSAVTDAPTVVSLTNHGYWNLAGEGTVADHRLAVAADRVLTIDAHLVPTGNFADVDGTALDLRQSTRLGDAIDGVPGGLDHCYLLRGAQLDPAQPAPDVRPAAVLSGGGRWMTVATDTPGMQVYTGNSLKPPFVVHGSVSLETQRLPDAPNHGHFGPCVLRPGEQYRSTTVLRFGTGDAPTLD